ncbi:hypothetical protein [Microbacterium sp. NPDC096154]|uniref:hypothetical protein n=1 Tax=Microbacterium sp. NPDC096154 TaxID=3155549 RepID=UPI00332BC2C6
MSGAGAGRRERRARTRFGALLAVGALALAGLAASVVWAAGQARAATVDLVVNSTSWTGNDASPGDGICRTSAGNTTCTLRAAIQESNARPAGDIVTITVDPSIAVGTAMTGSMEDGGLLEPEDRMLTSAITREDNGAIFNITKPVTIDLGQRLVLNAEGFGGAWLAGLPILTGEGAETALFHIGASNVQLLNIPNPLSTGTSFVVGAGASNVLIDGGGATVGVGETVAPERFVAIREGASGVTVRHYRVTGFTGSGASGGVFVFASHSATARSNIVIDDVDVVYGPTSTTTCTGGGLLSSADTSGCRTHIVNFWNGSSQTWTNNVTNGLTFQNMTVQNLAAQNAFKFAGDFDRAGGNSATISDLSIIDNRFLNNQGSGTGEANPFVLLPLGGKLSGETTISRNVFSRATSGQTYALYYAEGSSLGDQSTANSTTGSRTFIQDNHFDGYSDNTIRLFQTGLVTVKGNTFGARTASQAAAAVAEEYSDSGVMLDNYGGIVDYNANQNIRTWAPSAGATVAQGPLPAGALRAPAAQTALPTCTATVGVQRITDTNNTSKAAGEPVTIDVFWTANRTAELFLGSVTGVTGTGATLAFSLPVGQVTLPDGTAAQAVDPATAAVSGRIRLQTHVEGLGQLESSQYSRLVDVTGSCRPALTLEQATGQNDPTLGRDLHFTLTSSQPLEASSLTTADFGISAAAVAQTADAGRINARVQSVSEIAGSGGLQWDVVARVDDSAAVTLTLAAGTVTSTGGFANDAAAAGADPTVTYLNPVRVTPQTVTLIAGEPDGASYVIELATGAPVPEAVLTFASAITQAAGVAVSLDVATSEIPAAGYAAPAVTATASDGEIPAGTEVPIRYTLTSADSDYDGLVVPTVTARLYATHPALQIVKRAYVGAGDTSSPATIEATGTLVPSDERIDDGTPICFVYTVTNASGDDWTTAVTDIDIVDTDERLGDHGVIGHIGTLADGASQKFAGCTALVSLDTTADSAAGAGSAP